MAILNTSLQFGIEYVAITYIIAQLHCTLSLLLPGVISDNFSFSLSPEIYHTVWRTWHLIACSDESWLNYQFSLHHSYICSWMVRRICIGVKRLLIGTNNWNLIIKSKLSFGQNCVTGVKPNSLHSKSCTAFQITS